MSMLVAPTLAAAQELVDFVNPYIGNISHLLVPTFPTVQLPNSMLRVYPERADYTSELLHGLPLIVTNHRERSAFNLSAQQGDRLVNVQDYVYDNEHLRPYAFDVDVAPRGGATIHVDYAPSHQSAAYELTFTEKGRAFVVVNSKEGRIRVNKDGSISGYQQLPGQTRVYLYIEPQEKPIARGLVNDGQIVAAPKKGAEATGNDVAAAWQWADGTERVHLRYGISFISEDQAMKNLRREIQDFDVKAVAQKGRDIWNETLGKIKVEGGTQDEREVLYTSLYRTFERPICMSEDGQYWSAFDNSVHQDEGTPFYNDDWIWDTYRAAHPLRILLHPEREEHILTSFERMAQQMGNDWIPTFPEVNGDSRRMNSNHTVATFADAMVKGLNVSTPEYAYRACKGAVEEKTLAPWSGMKAGWIDQFYKEKGYIPALPMGQEETVAEVNKFEKRQPIAVTLGTSYDEWCLSVMAQQLGKADEAKKYLQKSYNYRNVFNPATGFFHPKDKDGRWIEPFDYAWSGGMGAREFYGENNGWVYRWDVQHNVGDLINLMGGRDKFIQNLNETFTQGLGRSKYEFYAKLPDHTGNIGQFSMANEPAVHIPYLYNYAGQPWMTQKRIRQVLHTWFRNDLMGVPGDEDGGGMTSFVVFSELGFYPVTPGVAAYNIGSPMFTHATISLGNGKTFEIIAIGASVDNKYIQSATLNGQEWNKPWFSHSDLMGGGKLVLQMGSQPNKQWGAGKDAMPPSVDQIK